MLVLAADSADGSFTVSPSLGLILWTLLLFAIVALVVILAIRWVVRRRRG